MNITSTSTSTAAVGASIPQTLPSQYSLHQSRYQHMNYNPSVPADYAEQPFPMTPLPSLSLTDSTFSIDWFQESDLIGIVAEYPREKTEKWNEYCQRIMNGNPQVYGMLKEECDEVFKTELEIKDSIETFMNQLVKSGDISSDTVIAKFKGLHKNLIESVQKLHVLEPLLKEIGIETAKIFTQLDSSNVIDGKIKEKGTVTADMDVTVASELFSLYVVKSCVGELTAEDKMEIKKLPLKLDDKTINFFLRGTNSAENIVAIQSIELFVQQIIDPQTIKNVHGNFLKLPNKENFDKLVQIYVALESYGSKDQKELIRDHLELKKLILKTIDANLEIHSLFLEDSSKYNYLPQITQISIKTHAENVFFASVKVCDDFFGSSFFSTLYATWKDPPFEYSISLNNSPQYQDYLEKQIATCKYILKPDMSPSFIQSFSSEEEVLNKYVACPTVNVLISSVKRFSHIIQTKQETEEDRIFFIQQNSLPNWPSYSEGVYSRGLILTQPGGGEMKWTTCEIVEKEKELEMLSCTIREFDDNMPVAVNLMSSFNEIVLNLEYANDNRFPTLALNISSSLDKYITDFESFEEQKLYVGSEFEPKVEILKEFVVTLKGFRYQYTQPAELGMKIIVNILQTSNDEMPSDYNEDYTITQMETFITSQYTSGKILFNKYHELANIISVIKLHQGVWDMKVKINPLNPETARKKSNEALYKFTVSRGEMTETSLRMLKEGQTALALSDEFYSSENIVPENSKVLEDLQKGTITPLEIAEVEKKFIQDLRTTPTTITSRNFLRVVLEREIFDQQFALLGRNLNSVNLVMFRSDNSVNYVFQIFNLCIEAKEANLFDLTPEQESTLKNYERDFLTYYQDKVNNIISMSDLITLRSKLSLIFQSYGSHPIMMEITLILHNRYLALSPSYKQSFEAASNFITSTEDTLKFQTKTDDERKIVTVISFYWATSAAENMDSIKDYILNTGDSPNQIINKLFILYKNPIFIPQEYNRITTSYDYDALLKSALPTDIRGSLLVSCQLLDYASIHLSGDPVIESLKNQLDSFVFFYLEENVDKPKLKIYTEIFQIPYIYYNPVVLDTYLFAVNTHFLTELGQVSLVSNDQGSTAVHLLKKDPLVYDLLTAVEELNIELFEKTPLGFWSLPQTLSTTFALPFDDKDVRVREFMNPDPYNPSDILNDMFHDPEFNYAVKLYDEEDVAKYFKNSSKDDTPNTDSESEAEPPMKTQYDIAVPFLQENYFSFVQNVFSSVDSKIVQRQSIKRVWAAYKDPHFVFAVLPRIVNDPFFSEISNQMQQSMIKVVKISFIEWTTTMIINKEDAREPIINLLLSDEFTRSGYLGKMIIDNGLGILYSLYKNQTTVNVISFSVELQKDIALKYKKDYKLNMVFGYVKKCFFMFTASPGASFYNSDFFKLILNENSIDKYFNFGFDDSETSSSFEMMPEADSSVYVITSNPSNSVASQRTTLTNVVAQSDQVVLLRDLNDRLGRSLQSIDFSLTTLLREDNLVEIEQKQADNIANCKVIYAEMLQVTSVMPNPPINIININPQLELTKAKFKFTADIQTFRRDISTAVFLDTTKLKGLIQTIVVDLQLLKSDPSYTILNTNLNQFKMNFFPLLDTAEVASRELQDELGKASSLLDYTGLVDNAYKDSLLSQLISLTKSKSRYKDLWINMNLELGRFTNESKISEIRFEYSNFLTVVLEKQQELSIKGDLDNYQLTQQNAKEIEDRLDDIGDRYETVDYSGEIQEIQSLLDDKNYALSAESKQQFQSKIDSMKEPQTKIQNEADERVIRSGVSNYLPIFDLDAVEVIPSLKQLLTARSDTTALFQTFRGPKTESIVRFESETIEKMDSGILYMKRTLETLEDELKNKVAEAKTAEGSLDEILLLVNEFESGDLHDLKEIKIKFDGNFQLLIEELLPDVEILSDQIFMLTEEGDVSKEVHLSDDKTQNLVACSEALKAVIIQKETEFVQVNQANTELAYTKVAENLFGVLETIVGTEKTPDTKELDVMVLLDEEFSSLYDSFIQISDIELELYNEMTYTERNSDEIVTRNSIYTDSLKELLDKVVSAISIFNEDLDNLKDTKALYDLATEFKNKLLDENVVNVESVNLVNTKNLYSELLFVKEELLKIPHIVLEEAFLNDLSQVEDIFLSLEAEVTQLKREVVFLEQIYILQPQTSIEDRRTKTKEYLHKLDEINAKIGNDQYDETHTISGMKETAETKLALAERVYYHETKAEREISEQREKALNFLSSFQDAINTNNVTETQYSTFIPQLEQYEGVLVSNAKEHTETNDWFSEKFVPLKKIVSDGFSLLVEEKNEADRIFSDLKAFREGTLDPLLHVGTIDDLKEANAIIDTGREKLNLYKTQGSTKIIPTEETLRKEADEIQSVTTALNVLQARVNDKRIINQCVDNVNVVFEKYANIDNPTLYDINNAIQDIEDALSYDPSNPEFESLNEILNNLKELRDKLTYETNQVKENVNAAGDTLATKQTAFNSAQEAGNLDLMRQISGEMETIKTTYGTQLNLLFDLTQSLIYDADHDIHSMMYTAAQQVIDNNAAIQSLSDKIHDEGVIARRSDNAANTIASEKAVLDYIGSVDNLIDTGKIKEEDVRFFQKSIRLTPLLTDMKNARKTEAEFIRDNKLTTEEDNRKSPDTSSVLTELSGAQRSVTEKLRLLIEKDTERTEKIEELKLFFTLNVDPFLDGPIENLEKTRQQSEEAKHLLSVIPRPVISRSEEFDASAYSEKLVQMDANVSAKSDERQRQSLESERQKAIQKSFSTALDLRKDVRINNLDLKESESLLPKISSILQDLDSRNVPKESAQYVELKQYEAELTGHLNGLHDTKAKLGLDATQMLSEIETSQVDFDNSKSDTTRQKIIVVSKKYINTLVRLDKISGENVHAKTIKTTQDALVKNNEDYIQFVQNERGKAAEKTSASDQELEAFLTSTDQSVDSKTITRTQLNEYTSKAQTFYTKLDKSVTSETQTIEKNKIPGEPSLSTLLDPLEKLLEKRRSDKVALDAKIAGLKDRDSVRSGKIQVLKQKFDLNIIYISPLAEDRIKLVYDSYKTLSSDAADVGTPEVIDDSDSDLSKYMLSVRPYLENGKLLISDSKKSIINQLTFYKAVSFPKECLRYLKFISGNFDSKFPILQYITSDEEKLEEPYLEILDIESKLRREIGEKSDKLTVKTQETSEMLDKSGEEYRSFIENYDKPKDDFSLDEMKTKSSELIHMVDLSVSNLREINKLDGKDTNSDKIQGLETQKGEILEIVSREELKASLLLQFRIDTAHNLTQSSKMGFDAFVSYWQNGIRGKQIKSTDDIKGVGDRYDQQKQVVLDAFDSEISLNTENSDDLKNQKVEFMVESVSLKIVLEDQVLQFEQKESERTRKHLEYKSFVASKITPLLNTRFDVDAAKLLYKEGLTMFQHLSKSEIQGVNDDTTQEELEKLEESIRSRERSIKTVTETTNKAKNAVLTSTAKFPNEWRVLLYEAWNDVSQSDINKTKELIDESNRLLALFDEEIIKLEQLYELDAVVTSVAEFKKVRNEEFIKINHKETINNEKQSKLDEFEAQKRENFRLLKEAIDTQSRELITNKDTNFNVVAEREKLSTFKWYVKQLREDLTQVDNIQQYDELSRAVESAISSRTLQLKASERQTNTQYQTTQRDIEALLPTIGNTFDEAYFYHINEQVQVARTSLDTLRSDISSEVSIQHDGSNRIEEINGLLQEQQNKFAETQTTIMEAKKKYDSDKLSEQQLLKEKVLEDINEELLQFGKDPTQLETKILEIGIDKSRKIVNESFDKLMDSDSLSKAVQSLREKLNVVSKAIGGIEHRRRNLKLQSLEVDSKITIDQNKITSPSVSDEIFLLESQRLIKLCEKGIEYKKQLELVDPSAENRQSILDQQTLKESLESGILSRQEKMESLRIFGLSEMLTGFGRTVEGQFQVLSNPVDNEFQYESVLNVLDGLKSNVDGFKPATEEQTKEKLRLTERIQEAIKTCNAEKEAFLSVQSKLTDVNSLLQVSPIQMGINEINGFRQQLSSAYDTFNSANKATASKYSKGTDIDTRYSSLMSAIQNREGILQQAYQSFETSQLEVNKMVEIITKEQIYYYVPSLGDEAYLFRVSVELGTLEDILSSIESSKSSLVSVIGQEEYDRIVKTSESAVTFLSVSRKEHDKNINKNQLLNEKKIKEEEKKQRINSIKRTFNNEFEVSFPTDKSEINLAEGQETLDKLCTGITLLRGENADNSFINDLENKYEEYNKVLTAHRKEIETAQTKVKSSKTSVDKKMAELTVDIRAENEESDLTSYDQKREELKTALDTAASYMTQLNDAMNGHDGPKEKVERYVMTKLEEVEKMDRKVAIIRERVEDERKEKQRKTQVNSWLKNSPSVMRDLKGDVIPENLKDSNTLKTNIELEYKKFDELNPTHEEILIRDEQMRKDLEPLNAKIAELNGKKDSLQSEEEKLASLLVPDIPDDPFTEKGHYDKMAETLREHRAISDQLQVIRGEKLVDNDKEVTIKDVEGMIMWFQKHQEDTLRLNVGKEGQTAEESIGNLKSLNVKRLDQVGAYKEQLANSRLYLDKLKEALGSYYTTSEKYFPDVSEPRNELKTVTEEFIKENTETLRKLDEDLEATITKLTEEKRVRDDKMNAASTITDNSISTAKGGFSNVSILIGNKDFDLNELSSQKEEASRLYDSALETIKTEKQIIQENTMEDISDKTSRIQTLNDKEETLMREKAEFDKSVSENPNILLVTQKVKVERISQDISTSLNSFKTDKFDMVGDKLLISRLQDKIKEFDGEVTHFDNLLGGDETPYENLNYQSQLDSIKKIFAERETKLVANDKNTNSAKQDAEKVLSRSLGMSNVRVAISDSRAALNTLSEALKTQVQLLNSHDKEYILSASQTESWIQEQTSQIDALEQQANNFVRDGVISKYKGEIKEAISERKQNLKDLTNTLEIVDRKYAALLRKYTQTVFEAEGLLASQTKDQQILNDDIAALQLSIFELKRQASLEKQPYDDFLNFVITNPDPDALLKKAEDTVKNVKSYIALSRQIDEQSGNPVVDNSYMLTSLEDFIRTKSALRLDGSIVLGQAKQATTTARENAASFITSLEKLFSNPEALASTDWENKLREARELVGLATQAVTNEIGALDKHGFHVMSLETVTETKAQLQSDGGVFQEEQGAKVNKIAAAAKSIKTTEALEEKLLLESIQKSLGRVYSEINEDVKNIDYQYARVNKEKLGESIFGWNKVFSQAISKIRVKLDDYEKSSESEYGILRVSPHLGDPAQYKKDVDSFIKSTEGRLVKIETKMKESEADYTKTKKESTKAENQAIASQMASFMKSNLEKLLTAMGTRIGKITSTDFYTNFDNDIDLAIAYMKGIDDYSINHETAVEREKTLVFLVDTRKTMFQFIHLRVLKHAEEKRARIEAQAIILETIANLKRELLSKSVLDAPEEADKLRIRIAEFEEEARIHAEKIRILVEEGTATANLDAESKRQSFENMGKKTGYDSTSFIDYIKKICLFLLSILEKRLRYGIHVQEVFVLFSDFVKKLGLEPGEIYANVLILVDKLEAIGGSNREARGDMIAYLLMVFDAKAVVTLVLNFIWLIKNTLKSSPSPAPLPVVPDVLRFPEAAPLRKVAPVPRGGPPTVPTTTPDGSSPASSGSSTTTTPSGPGSAKPPTPLVVDRAKPLTPLGPDSAKPPTPLGVDRAKPLTTPSGLGSAGPLATPSGLGSAGPSITTPLGVDRAKPSTPPGIDGAPSGLDSAGPSTTSPDPSSSGASTPGLAKAIPVAVPVTVESIPVSSTTNPDGSTSVSTGSSTTQASPSVPIQASLPVTQSSVESTSVQSNETVSPDVCKMYDNLFEERYDLFVPPSTEIRGGGGPGLVSGVGSNIFGPNTTVIPPAMPPPMPDFSQYNIPGNTLDLGPSYGIDFRNSGMSRPSQYDPKKWGTYSGHYESMDEDGNPVIELDELGESHFDKGEQLQRPPSFLDFYDGRPVTMPDLSQGAPPSNPSDISGLGPSRGIDFTMPNDFAYAGQFTPGVNVNAFGEVVGFIGDSFTDWSKWARGLVQDKSQTIDQVAEAIEYFNEFSKRANNRIKAEAEAAEAAAEAAEREAERQKVLQDTGDLMYKVLDNLQGAYNWLAGLFPHEVIYENRPSRGKRGPKKYKPSGDNDVKKDKPTEDNDVKKDKPTGVDDLAEEQAKKQVMVIPPGFNYADDQYSGEGYYAPGDGGEFSTWEDEPFDSTTPLSGSEWASIPYTFGKTIFNNVGKELFLYLTGSRQKNQLEVEMDPDLKPEPDSSKRIAKQKYFEEVTSKFLPTITTIKTENNLSGIDDLNLHVKDVISDGRCFSGTAFYLFKLNEQKRETLIPMVNAVGISWNVPFSPAEKESDSQELNTLITEKIIEPIKNKFDSKNETDLVEFVYEFHFGKKGVNQDTLNDIFESYERNIINAALSQLSLNEKIRVLLNKLDHFFDEEDEADLPIRERFSFTHLFKKTPQMVDYVRLRGSGNYLPHEIKFNPYTNKNLLKVLGIEDGDVSKITFEMLNKKQVEISNKIKGKPKFKNFFYTKYIEYIKSLNQLSESGNSYPSTEPTMGPAQVLASVYQTNVVIKYESSYNVRNVVYNPRDPVTNKFFIAPSTIYLLFKNKNDGAHYVALIDPEFNQEIRADAPPPPSNYTILELFGELGERDGHLHKNEYTFVQDPDDPSKHIKYLFRSIQTEPIMDDERYLRLNNMSEAEIEESKEQEKVAPGFRSIEGPRHVIIDGKASIYDYGISNYVSTNIPIPELPPFKILEVQNRELYQNVYSLVKSPDDPTKYIKQLLESTRLYPQNNNELYFKLYNMSEEEIEISRENEKGNIGFKTIEGPRETIIDGKDAIYDYESSQYITTYLTDPVYDEAAFTRMHDQYVADVKKFKYYKPIRLDGRESIYDNKNRKYVTKSSKGEKEEEKSTNPPSDYTILEINIGGQLVKNGRKGEIDETDGLFVEMESNGTRVVKKDETKEFVEVNPDGTIMKEDGIVIKNGKMGKMDDKGIFKEIPPPVTRWSTYLYTPKVHLFVEVYPENTYLQEGMSVDNGELQENTYDFYPDGSNKYKKHLKATHRNVQPRIDNERYFDLYNMSEEEIARDRGSENIKPGFKSIEGPRKAVIRGKDSIYDYKTSVYTTTKRDNPKFSKDLYDLLLSHFQRDPETFKKKKPIMLDGRESIFVNKSENKDYITKTPKPVNPMSGGGGNNDYDMLFETDFDHEKELNNMYYDDLFESEEPEPIVMYYDDLFESEEPEPIVMDYNVLFEMEQ